MKTIKQRFEDISIKRNAKKYWRTIEHQRYRDRLAKEIKWKPIEELTEILSKEKWTIEYAESLISCWRILNEDLANKLIDSWNWEFVAKNIKSFKWWDHNAIAKNLIDSWNWHLVKQNLSKFESLTEENLKILEEKEGEEKEKKDKLKEIWDKFLEFGIEYTIDEKSLLLNIKWDIKGKIFDDCYELGLFQYVERIDGDLTIMCDYRNEKTCKFIFKNLKYVDWNLTISHNGYDGYVYFEAEKLWCVNWNLELRNSKLNAPLKRISWNCDVFDWWILPSNDLEYIGGELYLYKYTAPMGSTDWWIYFPVLRYVGVVELNGYYMWSNKSITVGDNKVYWGVIYFIDSDDPRLEEKVGVICDYLSRKYNRSLYDSIPTNENYKTHIKSIPVDRSYDCAEDY